MLGAEEWGIATASLVVLGCIMMRKCHLNTCPVGIATQDPVLRKKFEGKPEWVVNYFFMLAEELREVMASLGFRTVNKMVGRVDLLDTRKAIDHWKAKGLDFSAVLRKPKARPGVKTYCAESQDHGIAQSLDITTLLDLCRPAIDNAEPVEINLPIRNVNRTVGTILSSEITRKYGAVGLHDDSSAKVVEHQNLVRLGQSQFPGDACMLDRSLRAGAGAAVVSRDEHHIRLGFGNASGDRADPNFRHQLDTDSGITVGVFQIVDQLCQILDRIDVVMWRWRDQSYAGRAVPNPTDFLIDLMTR
jgi:hypothetical protein